MSLADLLNNYSQEIGARVQHNEEVEQDNIDRKATTMQEKFEHAQSVIEGVGTELTSLGLKYFLLIFSITLPFFKLYLVPSTIIAFSFTPLPVHLILHPIFNKKLTKFSNYYISHLLW